MYVTFNVKCALMREFNNNGIS